VGHGIGLEISEFPLIASGVLSQLKAGMIIALEPRFVFPDIGMVGLEDMYLVTSAGLERLTITRQAVIGIS
jgi:Xaa-Pro aminopeptidase